MGANRYSQLLLEVDPDGHHSVWLLYRPEQDQFKDPNLYLWVRRCEVFSGTNAIIDHLRRLNINITRIYTHELFPELRVLEDSRGYNWYACKAPIYG